MPLPTPVASTPMAATTTPPPAGITATVTARRNPDATAPAKKSRENVCHDKSSPNYSTLKYFVSYPSLQACLTSGGRAFGA